MLEYLWTIPALPLAGYLVLALAGKRFSRTAAAVVGTGSMVMSMVMALGAAGAFIFVPQTGNAYTQTLYTWLQADGFSFSFAFRLDALSLAMMLVVTVVGFLIHLYSTEFMIKEQGYSRYFAYMNLFVAFMLILVLADNFLLLYLGWEGVGLCSYLLIGFWHDNPANGYAARKAFIVTRIGDTSLMIGMLLIFTALGTLNIQTAMEQAGQSWTAGSVMPVAAALLILGGSVGKSAQLPLFNWLPDAMAGPSPVSALIHAATMVTAGVYLIARTHVLFILAPAVLTLVAVIGAVTLLLSGFSALVQRDIKRVLAYSTISQIGYMFLALGVGAWSAAIFHLVIHAFFKSLLFLGAGSVILALDHEHDMFRMGGLKKQLPATFWTFFIGAATLSALPLVTAGFYSKDPIIWQSFASARGSTWIWAAALAGSTLTALYAFRMVFLTFFGSTRTRVTKKPGLMITIPLVVLAVLCLAGGLFQFPQSESGLGAFSTFMEKTLPLTPLVQSRADYEGLMGILSGAAAVAGIALIYFLIMAAPRLTDSLVRTAWGSLLNRLWLEGWGFDALYNQMIVRSFVRIAQAGRLDVVDRVYVFIAWMHRKGHHLLSATQTGSIRWYASGIVLGAVIITGLVVFL